MTKKEKKDKKIAMDLLNIPINIRSSFIRYANHYGRFNLHDDNKWYEWGPLEYYQKPTKTMEEMFLMYKNKIVL